MSPITIIDNFFTKSYLDYFLNLPEVILAKQNIQQKSHGYITFTVELPSDIKEIIYYKFGLSFNSVPMRWIIGDTYPHIDSSSREFEKTYLVYLTDSSGNFLIDNNSYPITKGSAFVFDKGLNHETINTELEPRLLLGPMSEEGLSVGAATIISGNGGTTAYLRYIISTGIQYSYDQNNWFGTSWPVSIENTDTSAGMFIIQFITDITVMSEIIYLQCITNNIQFGIKNLNNDGTRPKIIIDGSGMTNPYPGFIKNDYGGNSIHIFNLEVLSINGSILANDAGWLCQMNFGLSATDNYIINCHSDGIINGNYSGGIIGSYPSYNGPISMTIIGCSSSGIIQGDNAGGIVGQYANNITVKSCWITGNIIGDGAGGIVGALSRSVEVINCYSTGTISGNNTGGIIGSNAGDGLAVINNCYSNGTITGGNAGGICGSLAPSDGYNYTVSIVNCYSSGNLNNTFPNSNGGICGLLLPTGSGTITLTINNCYTCGTVTLPTGYIIGNISTINGSNGYPSNYSLNNNYSEAGSGGTPGSWNNINANNTLTGTPNITYSSSSIWQTIHGTPTPYELFNMGYSPYSITNISGNDLIRTVSSTINAGNSSSSAIKTFGVYYTFLEDYTTLQININNATGVISTTSSTPVGTYIVYVYNTGSYNITAYTLIIESPITPTSNSLYVPIQQSISFNQKSGFCGTRPVSSNAIALGSTRGKGSTTRVLNYCVKIDNSSYQQCFNKYFGLKLK
jgi:hypothetical protein